MARDRKASRTRRAQPIQDGAPEYCLRLYVAGASERSVRAVMRARELCETLLKGRYQLEVIDIYTRPDLLREDQIVAAPTLIRRLPKPERRLVGDLRLREAAIRGLELAEAV